MNGERAFPSPAATSGTRGRAAAAIVALALGVLASGPVLAQGAATPAKEPAPAAAARVDLDTLKGAWVRPDGGYTIVIKGVDAKGKLEAMYFNPGQLPFERAQATLDGSTLRASFELRAGGYGGSTYELVYDPAGDRLQGVYYQAVARQKFNVYFVRK